MKKTQKEIEDGLLQECKEKGFGPGSLLIVEEEFQIQQIPSVFHGKTIEIKDLRRNMKPSVWIQIDEIWMFVSVHAIDQYGSWDFWFEFLTKDCIVYVPAFEFMARLRYFEVK